MGSHIARHLDSQVRTFLDIGCNSGAVSSNLLYAGKVTHATGIDLSGNALPADLTNDENFRFIESDVTEIPLINYYDAAFYGAVHHHIVKTYGLGIAFQTLISIAEHCRLQLFFETGSLKEGPRWGWQRVLSEYFSTDEEHHTALLRLLSPRVASFRVIGRFPMHGVRRYLLCINLGEKPQTNERKKIVEQNIIPNDLYRGAPSYTRSVGSKRQKLRLYESKDTPASGVIFKFVTAADGKRYVTKRRPLFKHVDRVEYSIGTQASGKFTVQPLARMPDGALVFPFIPGSSITDWLRKSTPRKSRDTVASMLIEARRQLRNRIVDVHDSSFPHINNEPVFNVIDLHPRNILVTETTPPRVHIIDFEAHSKYSAARNDIRLGRILIRMRCRPFMASFTLFSGIIRSAFWVTLATFLPFEERVMDRKPSLLSLLIVKSRFVIETPLLRLFPFLKE
ncbi:methyltransferase domain-containing protein [Arhodomonas sp. SL1]|uniref:methyltransferase domain-containing protein n=1 Tax=Arhodomonas sp. SL1 TaxID=3425691 RepID=UPI003F881046